MTGAPRAPHARRRHAALLSVTCAAAVLGVGTAGVAAASAAPAPAPHSAHAATVASATAATHRAAGHGRAAVASAAVPARTVAVTRVVPAADRLRPVPVVGAQESMPITSQQYANAATIVHQAQAKNMGLRSAVIAVATAMQESRLSNLSYGTGESLGLFQQQPDCGWGTAQQIMNPTYAANAFLSALQQYQAANPGWASQPLYVAAQGVQASANPTAYAQWEVQAASLVHSITNN